MSKQQNTIFVGAKPPMNYVLAVVTQFNEGTNRMVLKARGRAISRAVDVAEIVRNRFVEEAHVEDVRIATERITTDGGKPSNVSSITIVLARLEKTTTADGPDEVLREAKREADDQQPPRPLTTTN